MADTKWSQFPNATPGNSDEVVGLHSGDNARFSIANIVAAVRQGLASIFVPLTRTINGKGLSSDISLDSSDIDYDNTGSGLTATDVQEAIDELAQGGGGGSATDITYDPTTSGASATNVQDALDEAFDDLDDKQDTITASGILKGDGQGGVSAATAGMDYQTPLTFDNTPTASSTNPVQSGGVYTDVRTRVPVYGKGVNLLRNWYFVGGGTGRGVFPVNQRGQTQYVGSAYAIDGWHVNGNTTLNVLSSGVQVTAGSGAAGSISGLVDNVSSVSSKFCTLSVLDGSGLHTGTGTLELPSSSYTDRISIRAGNRYYKVRCYASGFSEVQVVLDYGATSNVIYAIKLELGTEQTLCHNEGTAENPVWVLNEIPDYEYELYRCITSTADSTDTYANKSLATEQQLAYVETGTTASRAYAVGEYFCLNGLLYRVTTAISSGGTFTPGTNCKQVYATSMSVQYVDISGTSGGSSAVDVTGATGLRPSNALILSVFDKNALVNSALSLVFYPSGDRYGAALVNKAGANQASTAYSLRIMYVSI